MVGGLILRKSNMESADLGTDGNVQLDEGVNENENSVLIADPEAKSLLKGITVSRYALFS